jgi:hypothetical protein
MLRSKSLDRNSYDSGDWFNLLDFSMRSNGWGRGLPAQARQCRKLAHTTIAAGRSPYCRRSGADPGCGRPYARDAGDPPLLAPVPAADGRSDLAAAQLSQLGATQIPGLIVMSLRRADGVEIVTIFNATPLDLASHLTSGNPSSSTRSSRLRPTTSCDALPTPPGSSRPQRVLRPSSFQTIGTGAVRSDGAVL